MNSTVTQGHGIVQLPPMDARITPPPAELNVVIPKLQTYPVFPPSPKSLPDTPYPETPSITSPSPRKRQRRRSSSSRSRSSRSDAKLQPRANSHLLFEPRAFEDLYIERAYLAYSLQQQGFRTSDLMRKYCETEQQLRNLDDNQGRRSLRKQLSLLKCKVSQAAEQEKAIFSRLGDLYVEIQSREMRAQSWTLSSPSIAPSCSSPDSSGFPAPTAPFVGSSADFVPMGYFNNFHHSAGPSYTQPEPEVYGLETVDEAAEDILCGPNSSCASIESEITPDTPFASALPFPKEKNDCGTDFGDELDDTRFLVARERRMSLPCLRHAWPEA